MADITISRPHTRPVAELRDAVDDIAASLERQFGVRSERRGDAVHVEGRGVRARLAVYPDTVHVTATLGLVARPFRRALEAEIQRELDRHVG
ncbi:MAG: polyhydroxyalkanoic acid system family protein [Rubricoccaceae bacterium]